MVGALQPTAAILVIGNEILSGRTRDINIQFLAGQLVRLGIRVAEARIIPDDETAIIGAVRALGESHDYLFTTGGIGPTHDDITAQAIARCFGVALERNPEAEAMLRQHYKEQALTPARLKMADIPEGAALIDNPVSRAPGFRMGNVYVLAGVPSIVEAMFAGIAGQLRGGPIQHALTIVGAVMEGELGGPLSAVAARFDDLDIGSYPYFRQGRYGVSVVVRGMDMDRVQEAARQVMDVMGELNGDPELMEGQR